MRLAHLRVGTFAWPPASPRLTTSDDFHPATSVYIRMARDSTLGLQTPEPRPRPTTGAERAASRLRARRLRTAEVLPPDNCSRSQQLGGGPVARRACMRGIVALRTAVCFLPPGWEAERWQRSRCARWHPGDDALEANAEDHAGFLLLSARDPIGWPMRPRC